MIMVLSNHDASSLAAKSIPKGNHLGVRTSFTAPHVALVATQRDAPFSSRPYRRDNTGYSTTHDLRELPQTGRQLDDATRKVRSQDLFAVMFYLSVRSLHNDVPGLE
jgi:hypothetical protein